MTFNRNRGIWAGQLLTFLVLIACVVFLTINADRGFELSDYSYYLLWAQQPQNVVASHFPFGHFTQWLYHLSGGNIALFRLSGVVLLLAAAWLLTRAYGHWRGRGFNVSLFLLLGSTVLMHYHGWLHVPSYNWLALVSVMLVLSGVLYASTATPSNPVKFLSIILVAGGGVMAFYAKPTTAALMGLLVFCWVVLNDQSLRSKLGLLFWSGLLAVLLLWVLASVFFGSVSGFYLHLKNGVEFAATLQAKHTIAEILTNTQNQITSSVQWMFRQDLTRLWFGGWLLCCLGLMVAARWQAAGAKSVYPWAQGLFLLAALLICLFNTYSNRFVGHHFYLLYFMVFALWSTDVLANRLQGSTGQNAQWQWPLIALVSFLVVVASLAPSFGTNNLIVRHASMSVALIALAIFVLLDRFPSQALGRYPALVFAMVASLGLILVLQRAYLDPYRMPGTIADQTIPVQFVDPSKHLRVDAATAQHINGLLTLAEQGGWKAGAPLIDMTGGAPGALVVLDAQLVGTPWLIGGYKGSDVYVAHYLAHTDPQLLKEAWVLTAPNGRRRLSEALLSDLGLPFPDAYERLGQVRSGHSNEVQILWKPQ